VTALAALAVLAVLGTAGAGLTLAHRAVLVDSLDESLGDQADAVAGRLRAGRPVGDLPGDDVVVQVVGPGGTVLAASRPLPARRIWSGDPRRTTVVDGTMPNNGTDARVLATPVGDDVVYAAGTLEDVQGSTRVLAKSLLVAVPVITAVLAALIWWLVGRVLRPVEAIRAEVDRISHHRLDRRVPEPPTADEVARLAHTMNAMLERLAGSAERQRRFVADAAHELRSPLARIRAELEVDAAHPASADPAATHASVLEQTVSLQRLVDDLLLLARGDAGVPDPSSAGAVDLDDVVGRLAAERRGGGPQIDVRGVAPVQVCGDEAPLARAVANLLDNAVRYARTAVTVTLRDAGGAAVLTVADDGPGVPPDARDMVFERFTRLDDARSASGGAGLGLAIAREIAARYGGTLTLADDAPPGARFELRMPVAPGEGRRIGASAPG
jgi:signal transduction histidine kinase